MDLAAEVAMEKGDARTPAGTRSVHLRATPATGIDGGPAGGHEPAAGEAGRRRSRRWCGPLPDHLRGERMLAPAVLLSIGLSLPVAAQVALGVARCHCSPDGPDSRATREDHHGTGQPAQLQREASVVGRTRTAAAGQERVHPGARPGRQHRHRSGDRILHGAHADRAGYMPYRMEPRERRPDVFRTPNGSRGLPAHRRVRAS